MGDSTQPVGSENKRELKACPLCGERIPESSEEPLEMCPSCDFNFNLLIMPDEQPVPHIEPAYVPQLVFWLIGIQIGLSGLFALLFLFFAAPTYLWTPQLIAAIQLLAIVGLGLFAYLLHKQKGIATIRIGLAVIGVISLPPGVCSISAALAISLENRICLVCKRQIRWSAHVDCPHCHVSMHRFGSCRQDRIRKITATTSPETSFTEIDFMCPNCRKSMSLNQTGGSTNE